MSSSENIQKLLSQMTLAEKAGQMTQLTIDALAVGKAYQLPEPLQLAPEKLYKAIVEYKIGSVLNVGTAAHTTEKWRSLIHQIQELALKETRLGIPVLYGIDAIHGPNYTQGSTLFPQQLALASSWNTEITEELAAICAYETRASGIPWNFSPVLDLARNPVWPRIWESFGEDVHLSTQFGLAMVKGFQGSNVAGKYKVAACLKHFTGYGMPISGRDRSPAWIAERQLREYYLPAFEAAIKAGAATIMVNSGEINGIPVHANYHILSEILRDEFGFEGLIVTDWEDIKYLHDRHRVADSQKEAVRQAIMAGIDMSMVPLDYSFTDHLIELVKEGAIPESRLDESVARILKLKEDLGLFEQSLYPKEDYPDFGSESFRKRSLQAAEESIILLKNEAGLLPLPPNCSILLTGPTADTMRSLNGGWSYTWQGERTDEFSPDKQTILKAITNSLGEDKVKYVPGSDLEQVIDINAAIEAASEVDYILLCLGESSYTEFYGNIDDLNLPDAQKELAMAMCHTGKPVILILAEGRPRIISKFEAQIPAILAAFYPGNEGGGAIANIIFGQANPSAKLPITYPRYPNALLNYDHKFTEALPLQGKEAHYQPQFEFGQGLSYTQFEYRELQLSKLKLSMDEALEISVMLSNTGRRKGKEVVQLYISDLYASITPPVKRLRGFEKIELEPGESKTVRFKLQTSALAFVGQDNRWVVETGSFRVEIGGLVEEFVLI